MFNPLKTNATLVKKTLIIFVQKMHLGGRLFINLTDFYISGAFKVNYN